MTELAGGVKSGGGVKWNTVPLAEAASYCDIWPSKTTVLSPVSGPVSCSFQLRMRPNWSVNIGISHTVLLKSIRQSRVTGVLDVTNFGTFSRITEALDEYTFRHGRFKISIQGCSEQVSLAVDSLPTIFSPFSRFLVSNLTNIVLQTKLNRSSTVKNGFFPVQQQIC
jgi:hypothetical protein